MKKLIKPITTAIAIAVFAVMASSQTAKAQDMAGLKDKTPEQRAQMQTTMMKTKLQLDSVQTAKVQAINLKYAKKLDPVLKGDGSKMSKFKEMRSIQKDKDADLKAALTADQYKQYQDFEKEMKEKAREYMKQ